jgi:hypothetical protein
MLYHRFSPTGTEKLGDKYKPDPKLSFIIKAIYAMAYGLHNMHQDICGRDAVGLCRDLFPFNGPLFKVSHTCPYLCNDRLLTTHGISG